MKTDFMSAGWGRRIPLLLLPSHSFRSERVKASGKESSCDPEEVGVSTSSQVPCSAQPSARRCAGGLVWGRVVRQSVW